MGPLALHLLGVAMQIEKLEWSLEKEVFFLSKVDQLMLEVNKMEGDDLLFK